MSDEQKAMLAAAKSFGADVERAKELRPAILRVKAEMCKHCKIPLECCCCTEAAAAAVLFNLLQGHLIGMQRSLAFEIAHHGFSIKKRGAK